MAQRLTLDKADRHVPYRITGIRLNCNEQLRLMELGFKTGSMVALLQRPPFCKLLKVKIKNTRFAIRPHDASCIEIEPLEAVVA